MLNGLHVAAGVGSRIYGRDSGLCYLEASSPLRMAFNGIDDLVVALELILSLETYIVL